MPLLAGVDNAAEYRATRHAMDVVGVSAAEQDSVMRVVAGRGLTLVHFSPHRGV
jgi:myosin heavy subunit